MSKQMKKCKGDLKFLGACSDKTRRLVLKNGDGQLIKSLAEAAYAVLDGRVKLSAIQRSRFKKDQSILRLLASKQRTLAQKRKVVGSQRGGNIIGFLLNAIKNLF